MALFQTQQKDPKHFQEVEYCLKYAEYLNSWEKPFLASLVNFQSLTKAQRNKLDAILDKIDFTRNATRKRMRR